MVTAVDAGALTNILNTAKEDGIKILVYDQQLEKYIRGCVRRL